MNVLTSWIKFQQRYGSQLHYTLNEAPLSYP